MLILKYNFFLNKANETYKYDKIDESDESVEENGVN